jgi:hypothetical protein
VETIRRQRTVTFHPSAMNLAQLPEREIQRYGEPVSVIFEDRAFTNVQMHKAAAALPRLQHVAAQR